MNCKLVLFFALASLIAQAYASPRLVDEAVLFEDDPSGDGDDLLEKLVKLVKDAIDNAKQKLEDLAKSFSDKVKSIVKAAEEKLSKQLHDLLSELEELKNDAKALGVNVTDCLKDREDSLKNLPAKYMERNLNCSRDAIAQGKAIINDTMNQVGDKFQEVKYLKEEFSACGSGLSSLSCKAVVIYKIQKTIAFLPVKILEIAADAVPKVWSLNANLTKCVFKNNQEFYKEGKQIVADISECIKSKITPPHNSTATPAYTTESSVTY